jgi:ABC-2 type transport system permease protein
MSTLTYAMADSATMLRRNMKRMLRYPTLVLFVVAIPVVLLLLFVYVFGGTLGAGLGVGMSAGRTEYANYLAPGILVLTVAGAGQGTAISVAMDMTEGIVARFKTMAIGRAAVLGGHVLGTLIQTGIGLVAVLAVALLVGFRPDADIVEWVAAVGLLAMIALAITWLCVACGLAAKSVETASNIPMPLMLLPFLSSGFAPTDQMPAGVRWFAEHQPFTPFIETLRGLLTGTAIGSDGVVAVAWCVAITVLSYVWATRLYDRDPSRS